ncbi:hypothetical protein M9R85_07075 [Psychrobacillus psychrodurans]|nr:hypothetical protein [Psychrobacillus psychrodurans]
MTQATNIAWVFFKIRIQMISSNVLKHGNKKGETTIFCKVRMTVPKNIKLYISIEYEIYDEVGVHKPDCINIKVVSMIKSLK